VRYALLVYSDQSAWRDLTPEDAARQRAESLPAWEAAFAEIGRSDPDWDGRELAAASTAKVIRVRDGRRIVTDGPFADTKEVIGGFFVVDLPDLDEAIRLAAVIPAAAYGSMEIRPLGRQHDP
jgi:hypothetical protein